MSSICQHVLVTGGAGFIGSHLSEALLRRAVQVTIVDNLDPFYSPVRKRESLKELRRAGHFKFFQADICRPARLRRILAQNPPDAVVHLAARAGVRPSILYPARYARVNIVGTVNLLELCRKLHVRKFIFGSSSSVYGAASKAPFSEQQTDLCPISPYAATKLGGEMVCYTYAHLYDLPTVCLRFFTVYGPRQRPDLAIHKFTELIEEGKRLPVFGDGSTGRDYTYIDDIVAGILAALNYDPVGPAGVPFEVFNLGNSHPVTLAELIRLLQRVTGRRAMLEQKPLQPGDVPLTWADISKAAQVLGYCPEMPLEEGLERFVHWYREAKNPSTNGLSKAVPALSIKGA